MFRTAFSLALIMLVTRAFAVDDAINQCLVCHSVEEDSVKIGPSLKGVIGRKIASSSYDYSPAFKALGQNGVVWDEATLRKFLSAPSEFASGTKMTIEALDGSAIDSVIAALQSNLLHDSDQDLMAGFDESLSDVDYGEYLASECMTCHQTFDSNGGIPALGNKSVEQFYQLMQAYKQGALSNQTMKLIASKLSDEEIISLAAYFANQNP